MKLYLEGHDYRYAVEQIMLALFPDSRPEYPETPPAPGEDSAFVVMPREALRGRQNSRSVPKGRCFDVSRETK